MFTDNIKVINDIILFAPVIRQNTGTYFCAVSNQLSPTISRRIVLDVQCKILP